MCRTMGTLHEKLWKYFEAGVMESDVENPYSESFLCGVAINKLFQNTMGCSFHDYVIHTRLDEAKNLLQKNENLDTIAEMVGFCDLSIPFF